MKQIMNNYLKGLNDKAIDFKNIQVYKDYETLCKKLHLHSYRGSQRQTQLRQLEEIYNITQASEGYRITEKY